MISIPIEIINYIYSFIPPHPVSEIIGNIIKNGYYIDYDPFHSISYIKYWYHESCFFSKWYFDIIRKNRQMNYPRFMLTPSILLLGNEYYWYWITNES